MWEKREKRRYKKRGKSKGSQVPPKKSAKSTASSSSFLAEEPPSFLAEEPSFLAKGKRSKKKKQFKFIYLNLDVHLLFIYYLDKDIFLVIYLCFLKDINSIFICLHILCVDKISAQANKQTLVRCRGHAFKNESLLLFFFLFSFFKNFKLATCKALHIYVLRWNTHNSYLKWLWVGIIYHFVLLQADGVVFAGPTASIQTNNKRTTATVPLSPYSATSLLSCSFLSFFWTRDVNGRRRLLVLPFLRGFFFRGGLFWLIWKLLLSCWCWSPNIVPQIFYMLAYVCVPTLSFDQNPLFPVSTKDPMFNAFSSWERDLHQLPSVLSPYTRHAVRGKDEKQKECLSICACESHSRKFAYWCFISGS